MKRTLAFLMMLLMLVALFSSAALAVAEESEELIAAEETVPAEESVIEEAPAEEATPAEELAEETADVEENAASEELAIPEEAADTAEDGEGNPTYSVDYDDFGGNAAVKVGVEPRDCGIEYEFTQNTLITFTLTPPEDRAGATPVVEIQIYDSVGENADTVLRSDETDPLKKITIENNQFTYTPGNFEFIVRVWWSPYDEFCTTDDCPNLAELHCNGAGEICFPDTWIEGEKYFVSDYGIKVRLADNEPATIQLKAAEYNYLDGIRVEQEGTEDNPDGFVDLGSDKRYNAEENTFTIDIGNEKYNPDKNGAFVNINFDFSDYRQLLIKWDNQTQEGDISAADIQYKIGDDAYQPAQNNQTVFLDARDVDDTCYIYDGQNITVSIKPRVTAAGPTGFAGLTVTVAGGGTKPVTTVICYTDEQDCPIQYNPDTQTYTYTAKRNANEYVQIEIIWDDIWNDWYTVSWGGGNVTIENGQVIVERIRLGDTTYTNIQSEVNEDEKVYYIPETIGKQETESFKPLEEYGMAYGPWDLFIRNDIAGVKIDFKFIPDYGYQFETAYTNEEKTANCLAQFDPDDEVISRFTFNTKWRQNVHFQVAFEAEGNEVDYDTDSLIGMGLSTGGSPVESGTLALRAGDAATDTSITDAVHTFELTMENVVSKGGENGAWIETVSELDSYVTVTLDLDTDTFAAEDYNVVRTHGEGESKETVYLDAEYDKESGMLSFATDKFSEYTIVENTEASVTPQWEPKDRDDGLPSFTTTAIWNTLSGITDYKILLYKDNELQEKIPYTSEAEAESCELDLTLKIQNYGPGIYTFKISYMKDGVEHVSVLSGDLDVLTISEKEIHVVDYMDDEWDESDDKYNTKFFVGDKEIEDPGDAKYLDADYKPCDKNKAVYKITGITYSDYEINDDESEAYEFLGGSSTRIFTERDKTPKVGHWDHIYYFKSHDVYERIATVSVEKYSTPAAGKAPQTGDSNALGLWLGLAGLSVAAMAAALTLKRKEN